MSFQLNYCIMLFVVVSSSALLHCTANVNLTNTRCALDYLRLDSPYCPLLSQTKTHTLFPFLALTGAQEVTLSVCVSVFVSMIFVNSSLNLHDSCPDLSLSCL